jgi:hypothetical protein
MLNDKQLADFKALLIRDVEAGREKISIDTSIVLWLVNQALAVPAQVHPEEKT